MLYCVLLYKQSALQSCVGGGGVVSSSTTSVQHPLDDDVTAATGQQHQCAHHTPATGGEERELEPIKLMGIIRRPWLTRASGGNLARMLCYTLLFTRRAMGFLMTTESQDLVLTFHPKDGACWQYSVPVTILGHYDPHRPQGKHPLLVSLTPLPATT